MLFSVSKPWWLSRVCTRYIHVLVCETLYHVLPFIQTTSEETNVMSLLKSSLRLTSYVVYGRHCLPIDVDAHPIDAHPNPIDARPTRVRSMYDACRPLVQGYIRAKRVHPALVAG